MNVLRKFMCLILWFALSTCALPLFAADSNQYGEILRVELTDEEMQSVTGGSGNLDATMSEYIKYDPTKPPIAEAVVSNRSTITVPYVLDLMDFNGASLEILASGTLAPGETKIISGSGSPGISKRSVRVKVGGDTGLVAIDTASLIVQRQ